MRPRRIIKAIMAYAIYLIKQSGLKEAEPFRLTKGEKFHIPPGFKLTEEQEANLRTLVNNSTRGNWDLSNDDRTNPHLFRVDILAKIAEVRLWLWATQEEQIEHATAELEEETFPGILRDICVACAAAAALYNMPAKYRHRNAIVVFERLHLKALDLTEVAFRALVSGRWSTSDVYAACNQLQLTDLKI